MENPKDYTSIPLYDLMIELGILDKPVVGKGKPAISKRIPKKVLKSSIMSIFMMGLVQGRSPSKKGQLKSIPDDLLQKISNDRVARLYMQDNIEILCEKSVHDRILTDTAKVSSWDRTNKLRVFEARLLTEADSLGLNITELRD